jgi:UDP-N-acetyl-D-mannosaminuronate dehydrogenase
MAATANSEQASRRRNDGCLDWGKQGVLEISVIGLGHLGLPLAALLAACGHQVSGVDSNASHISQLTPPGGTVAILGLAFRQNTDVLIASPAIAIAEQLESEGVRVNAWDPRARPAIGQNVRVAGSLADCVRDADTVLIANNDPLCADISGSSITRPNGRKVPVFDFWRQIPPGTLSEHIEIRHFCGPRSLQ